MGSGCGGSLADECGVAVGARVRGRLVRGGVPDEVFFAPVACSAALLGALERGDGGCHLCNQGRLWMLWYVIGTCDVRLEANA